MKKINRYSTSTKSENIIIQGDNTKVIDQMREHWEGKIKCIYIDPPYNNGENYVHYRDAKKHEDWLCEMSEIIHKLKTLLREDGSLWISIDDSELHYLKVAADLAFGRNKFISTIVWQHRITRENRNIFSNNHEYILVYAKNPNKFKAARNLLDPTSEILTRYKNPDNDHRGAWQSISLNVQAGHAVESQFYEIIAPNGKKHLPPKGRCWVYNKSKMEKEIKSNNIWFGKDGNGVPRRKKFLDERIVGVTPETLWFASEVGTTESAKKHILSLFPEHPVFDTPKPEQLIKKILEIATNTGDIVLDAFLGSGTTTAVAHKMNRRYIGIELGNHVIDYVVLRMKSVVEGETGGISQEVGWKGGGGFNFYRSD